MTDNLDKLIEEFKSKKGLIELLESGFKKDSRNIDGNKLSTLAVKIASKIDTNNKNIKALSSLALLSIACNLSAGAAQRLLTKALGLLS